MQFLYVCILLYMHPGLGLCDLHPQGPQCRYVGEVDSQRTPHTLPSRASNGGFIMDNLEKCDGIKVAPHWIYHISLVFVSFLLTSGTLLCDLHTEGPRCVGLQAVAVYEGIEMAIEVSVGGTGCVFIAVTLVTLDGQTWGQSDRRTFEKREEICGIAWSRKRDRIIQLHIEIKVRIHQEKAVYFYSTHGCHFCEFYHVYMSQIMELRLSCYLVLLSIDSKTR